MNSFICDSEALKLRGHSNVRQGRSANSFLVQLFVEFVKTRIENVALPTLDIKEKTVS
jgi:hypothetical protein